MSHRQNETDKTHFRTDRVVHINNRWYFLTREEEQPIGPFSSHESAVREAHNYLKDLKQYSNPSMLYRPLR